MTTPTHAAVAPQLSVIVQAVGDHLHGHVHRPDGGDGTTQTFVFGLHGDRPMWGDWDGNGTFTPGVVRGHIWYLRNAYSAGLHQHEFAYATATGAKV